MSIIEMKQNRFRQLQELSHTDLLWLVMRNEYGSGWSMDFDCMPLEEEE